MTACVQGVIHLTPSIRKKASANIWQRKEEAFDMAILHELIQKTLNSTEPQSQENVFEQLRQIDLTRFIKEAPGVNLYFTCSFFVKRYAWISQNEKGEYRYFSKIKDGYGYYAFDLFDLLAILMNQSTKKTIQYLQDTFSVENISNWDEQEKEKYDTNTRIIQSLSFEETPSLKRLLQTGTDILSAFLEFGKEKVNGKHLSDGEHALFFLSTHFFKERFFPTKSVSTLNQWVNLFAVLGLIEKTTHVPNELQVEAEKQQALKKKHNHISFYCVPRFDSVLAKAELRASLLVKNRISYHQVTKAVVLSLFGHAVHDHVYVQKTHGRKRKVTKNEREYDSERTYTFFYSSLAEKGIVVKKELIEITQLPSQVFNELWKELVSSANCKLAVPTKDECQKYGLSYQQTVARARKEQKDMTAGHIWSHEHTIPWDEPVPILQSVPISA